MYQWTRILFLIMVVCLFNSYINTQNLIGNGELSNVDEKGNLTGWAMWSGVSAVKSNGNTWLRVKGGGSILKRFIPVNPDNTPQIIFSCRIKVTDVVKGEAIW